jgi:16S rRNA (guanine1207-N2)-methyltransferase
VISHPSTTPPGDQQDRLAAVLGRVSTGRSDAGPPREDAPVAVDATDRLLLDEASPHLEDAAPGDVVVVGDRFGALTLGALALGAPDVRVHTDELTAEQALEHNLRREVVDLARGPRQMSVTIEGRALRASTVHEARLVLLQLPKSLDALREVAELVAAHAADDVVVLAGGRVKHMTRAMNDVLSESFADVRATLARQKSRALVATGVRPERREGPLTYPLRARLTDTELVAASGAQHVDVVAHGAAFGGAALDPGTRLLLSTADRWPAYRDAVDLGCGTGVLATALALRSPGARVVATDRSAAAVASTVATLRANGVPAEIVELEPSGLRDVRAVVVRDDAGSSLPDASADLVLCNPPFHDRTAVSTDAAHRMFATAGRVLRPGGELWTVFNTPLRYRPALSRAVGPTEQVARDPRFTVLRSVRA